MKIRAGQSTIEFAVLILIFICAMLAMTVYMKRGIQGQYRSFSNEIGDQYDPKHTTSNMTTTRTGVTTTVMDAEETPEIFKETTNATVDQVAGTTGTEHIAPMDAGLF